jgi:hypothetical protein
MSKKEEEIVKPGKYGLEKVKKTLFDNIVGAIFMASLVMWMITMVFTTLGDIVSGEFEHKVLSSSFIGGVLTMSVLTITKWVRHKRLGIKKPKKKKASCKKCGENKTKK